LALRRKRLASIVLSSRFDMACAPVPVPADDFYDHTATFARTQPLNRYLKKRAAKEGVNLLSGKNSTGASWSVLG
jgi:hypothetical protein